MKKYLLIIITHIILTNSSIQSADWISENLPKSWQVDQIYRDQVKFIQEKTGTSTPIIFMTLNDDSEYTAAVINIGAGPCRIAVMRIKQSAFQKDSFDKNILTLTHETVHVDQNHRGVLNAMLFGGLSMVGSSPLLKIAQFATSTPLRAGRTLALGLSLTTGGLYSQNRKYDEYEADQKGLEKIKQLGLCDTLENLSSHFAFMAHYNIPRHKNYAQYSQLQEWAEKECLECRQNERK